MKPYYKLSNYEKYKMSKKLWPLYIFGIIIFYWKLNFIKASFVTAILITFSLVEMHFLKKKVE